jgi:hypothetical protein
MKTRMWDACKNELVCVCPRVSTHLYLSVKELHVAEARNPHIGCSGLWKAEASCAVLATACNTPTDAALQTERAACPWD